MKKHPAIVVILMVLFSLLGLSACQADQKPIPHQSHEKLQVVATTTFVGDVVSRIGGGHISLTVMLSPGANPHAYQPAPRDIAAVNQADIVFASGVNLEVFLDDLIQNAGGDAEIVRVSDGIELREFDEKVDQDEDDHAGEENDHDEGEDHERGSTDPHVWLDPNNVLVWTENIEDALVRLDPENEAQYRENARVYREELRELDSWIRGQVSRIPEENREMVTDHTAFGYFADRYGFEQIGAVIPAPTTEAEPSGQQIAALIEAIKAYDVKAIFVGKDFDPTLSRRVAEDTGVKLISLYFGSLTAESGPASTYLDFMRYNVRAIVEGLQE